VDREDADGDFCKKGMISRPVKQLQGRFHQAGRDAKAQRKAGEMVSKIVDGSWLMADG